jgi:hypothetical protein
LDQVLRIFHANGKSKEFRYDTKPFPLFNWYISVSLYYKWSE